jgi:hypothetical protein
MTTSLNAAEFMKAAGVGGQGGFFGGDLVEQEAKRLMALQKSLIGASNAELNAAIVETAKKAGFYTGQVGDDLNKLYQKFMGNITNMILNPIKEKEKDKKPPKSDPNSKINNANESFLINNTIDLVERTNKIKQKGEDVFAKFQQEKLDESAKRADIWFNDVLNGSVDYYDQKKQNDEDYYNNLFKLEEESKNKLIEFGKAQADMLSSYVTSAITDISQGFADLLMGNASFDEFFASIFARLGEFMKQMGAAIVAYGVAFQALKNPITAIPAGIMLITAGALISALAKKSQKMAFGGVVPDGYPNDSYPALLTSGETVVPAKRLPDFGAQQVEVFGVIKAGDIYLSNQRGSYLKNRKG